MWALVAGILVMLGCSTQPIAHPEATCQKRCMARAQGRCNEAECNRGCHFVLDRLLERQGDSVIACVAEARMDKSCEDRAWAGCAARIGVHADGGPPVPASPYAGETEE
jgi:hypothetical protein